MTARDTIGELLDACRDVVTLAAGGAFSSFLADWPKEPLLREVRPATLPVARWIGLALQEAPVPSVPALARLKEASPILCWRQTYSAADVGEDFLRDYGWTELVGPDGPAVSTRMSSGILLLGPNVTYPEHGHEAEEIYVPIAGAAEWRQGAGDWLVREPGSVIHHSSHEPHAMRTGPSPLVAMFVWSGPGIGKSARLAKPSGPDGAATQ